jgi:cytochrome c-type biogenesis protein CcmF
MLSWKRADLAGVLGRLKLALGAAVLAAAIAYTLQGGAVLPVLAMGLAAWLFVGSLVEWGGRVKLFRAPLLDSLHRARHLPRSAHGTALAHAGLAILMAGIVAASNWKGEAVQILRPGETVELAGYVYRLDSVEQAMGPNYSIDRARLTVTTAEGAFVALLDPEKRLYPVRAMPTTEAAIHSTAMADLYVVIGDSDGQGGWTVRIFHEPLVPWIWAGALIMVLGGLISLSDRRLRVGAPTRRRKAPAAAAAARA